MPHGKTGWLTVFGGITAATSGNYRKPTNTLSEQNSETEFDVKVGGTYSYHCALNE
jgi:hypothetical protein